MLEVAVLLLSFSEVDISPDSLAALRCRIEDFSAVQQSEFRPVEVEGIYRLSFEVAEFRPGNSDERWWTASRELSMLMNQKGVSELRVILKGMLSPEGRYGHLRSYRYCLAEPTVVKVFSNDVK